MKVIKAAGEHPDFPYYRFVGDPNEKRWFVFSKGHPDVPRMMIDEHFASELFFKLTHE